MISMIYETLNEAVKYYNNVTFFLTRIRRMSDLKILEMLKIMKGKFMTCTIWNTFQWNKWLKKIYIQ